MSEFEDTRRDVLRLLAALGLGVSQSSCGKGPADNAATDTTLRTAAASESPAVAAAAPAPTATPPSVPAPAAPPPAAAASSVDTIGGKVILENDKVRVIAHQARPRMGVCGTGLHSHPPHLTIVLTDTKAKVTLAGKEPFIVENKAGDVFWDPGGPHAVENLGSKESKVYLVEIKRA